MGTINARVSRLPAYTDEGRPGSAEPQKSRKLAGNVAPAPLRPGAPFQWGAARAILWEVYARTLRAQPREERSMTDQRDSLAREIDEELRREQLLKLWERYGTYLIAAAALIIIGIGGFKYFEHRQIVAAETAGARFTAAAREAAQNSTAEAQKALEEIQSTAPAGYAALARLRLAAADRQAGRRAEALAAYEAIAKERGFDPLLADFARLQAASLRLDSADWTEMQNRLNDLVADGNPWRFSARELLSLAAQKAGKTEEARNELQRLLADRGTPPGIGERARMMLAMLTEAELAAGAATPTEPKAPSAEGQAAPPASAPPSAPAMTTK